MMSVANTRLNETNPFCLHQILISPLSTYSCAYLKSTFISASTQTLGSTFQTPTTLYNKVFSTHLFFLIFSLYLKAIPSNT